MPKLKEPLTDAKIESIQPSKKIIKLFDGGGLYLLIQPIGTKLWRLKYRFQGKEKSLSFGSYHDISLPEARLRRNEARLLLDEGLDPSGVRKEEKQRSEATGLAEAKEKPFLRVGIDGTFEIWKGHSAIRLTIEEAQFIKDLLIKLL